MNIERLKAMLREKFGDKVVDEQAEILKVMPDAKDVKDEATFRDAINKIFAQGKDIPESFKRFFSSAGQDNAAANDVEKEVNKVAKDTGIKQLIASIIKTFNKKFAAIKDFLVNQAKLSPKSAMVIIIIIATGIALAIYALRKKQGAKATEEQLTEGLFDGLDSFKTSIDNFFSDLVGFMKELKKGISTGDLIAFIGTLVFMICMYVALMALSIYEFTHAEELAFKFPGETEKSIKQVALVGATIHTAFFMFIMGASLRPLYIEFKRYRNVRDNQRRNDPDNEDFLTASKAFKDLGFKGKVSPKEVKKKFRELVKTKHPAIAERLFKEKEGRDITEEEKEEMNEAFRLITRAYKFLKRKGLAEALSLA